MSRAQVLLQLLRWLAPYRWRMTGAVLLSFLTIGASVGLMATSGYLISAAALHPETILLLWVPIVGVRFFGISRGVFRYFERIVSHDLTFRLLGQLRVHVYRRLEPHALRLSERFRYGDLINTVVSDVDTLQNLYLRVIAPPVAALLTGGLVLTILASLHGSLGLIAVACLAISALGVAPLAHMLSRRSGARMVGARADLATDLTDSLQGMTDLIVLGRTDNTIERLQQRQIELSRQQQTLGVVGGLPSALVPVMTQLSVVAVLCAAIPLVRRHTLPGVDLAVVVMSVLAAFEAIAPLPAAFSSLEPCLAAGRRLFATLGGAGEISDAPADLVQSPVQRLDVQSASEIVVRDLCVRYVPDGPDVLTGVNLDLRKGRHIAIVGPSGSGKTTLTRVLSGLLAYNSGSIKADGRELRSLSSNYVHDQFSVVTQHTYLFNTSIEENLRLARQEASQAELEQAAGQAQILDWIRSLPEGFATSVGEQGMRLSGGQRQRLALARSLLRKSPFLILDEPTNGLDFDTEREFMSTLRKATREQSVLLITHRLNNLAWMDEVILLRHGQVAERGTHEGLIGQRQIYWRMWQQQRASLFWAEQCTLPSAKGADELPSAPNLEAVR